MLESVTLFLTDRVIAAQEGGGKILASWRSAGGRRLRDEAAPRLADRAAGVPLHQDERINSATDHVSKVQVEPDGVFYNSVPGVARQCVGRRLRIRCLPAQ